MFLIKKQTEIRKWPAFIYNFMLGLLQFLVNNVRKKVRVFCVQNQILLKLHQNKYKHSLYFWIYKTEMFEKNRKNGKKFLIKKKMEAEW